MSQLADKLSSVAPVKPCARRGPEPSCEVYGRGSFEDWQAVDQRRRSTSWAEAQKAVEQILDKPHIKDNHFRYHWAGKCRHFDHVRDQIETAKAER